MHLGVWPSGFGGWAAVLVLALAACSFSSPAPVTNDAGIVVTVGFLAPDSLEDESSGVVKVPVTLNVAAEVRTTVAYSIADGSATRGSDYSGMNGTLVFEPGESQADVELAIVKDDVEEPDETIVLKLSSPSGAVLGTDEHVITINSSILPRASITLDNSRAPENQSPTVLVNLDMPSPTAVRLDYSIAGEVSATDYDAGAGFFTVPANATTFEVAIAVLDDSLAEFEEDLVFRLTGSPDVIITPNRTRTHAIVDNDPDPQIEIANATTVSEDSDPVEVTVSLSAVSGKPVDFVVARQSGDATLGADFNYASTSGSIPAGSTSTTVRIDILADELDEEDTETAVTRLDSATNAIVNTAKQLHTLSITDDDPLPEVSFNCGGTTNEPNSPDTTSVKLEVVLDKPSGRTVTVTLVPDENNPGGADEGPGQDYTLAANQRTLAIPAGATKAMFEVVILSDDPPPEPDETIEIDFGMLTNATAGSTDECRHVIAD